MGWSILRLCHRTWCLQSFLSMKNPRIKPRAHTLSPPAAFRSNVCNLFMCFNSGRFRRALSHWDVCALISLARKGRLARHCSAFRRWPGLELFSCYDIITAPLSQVCAQRKYEAVMCPMAGWWTGHEVTSLSHASKEKVEVACRHFCCWQDMVTFPLSLAFSLSIHARLFSPSVSLKHAQKYSVCGLLLCVRISRSP